MTRSAELLAGLTVLALLAVSCAEPVRETVDGNQPQTVIAKVPLAKREVFDFAKYPALTAVGKLSLLGGTWCTLALVDEKIAVTAGHCLLVTNFKFDFSKPIPEGLMSVRFRPKGAAPIENISVRRVIKASLKPDFAIVELNRRIPPNLIRPLKVKSATLADLRNSVGELGCAGFNGDAELGSSGMLMTISREIEIVDDSLVPERLDTNCYATYGGSGGPFFRQNGDGEAELLGVVWGVTDVEYDQSGKLVATENVTTSVTSSEVFLGDLRRLGVGK